MNVIGSRLFVANGLNHPDAKQAKVMPPARTLSATIFPMAKRPFGFHSLTGRRFQCFTSQQEPEAQPVFWFHGSFDNNTGTLDRTPRSVNR
jgi:hypothetical protein